MKLRTLRQAPIAGKRVLVRVDFNVSFDVQGKIGKDEQVKLKATLPTIKYLQDKNAKIILVSHLGRPEGKSNPKLSLKPVAQVLEKILKQKIQFLPEWKGPKVKKAVAGLKPKEILLLENIRFDKDEEDKKKENLARELAGFADIFINDAFAASHRDHQSVSKIQKFLPSYAGLLLEKEVKNLSRLIVRPRKPYFAVLSGAKVSTKIGLIENLLKKVDALFLGGSIANVFLEAKGYSMGKSLIEERWVPYARKLLKEYPAKLRLPYDLVVGDHKAPACHSQVVKISAVPEPCVVLDLGPLTIKNYVAILKKGKTIIWNGPVGVFEMPRFRQGTKTLAENIAKMKVFSVGGGDTLIALEKLGLTKKFSFVSTGGGAMLEFLEKDGKLPGIVNLCQRQN